MYRTFTGNTQLEVTAVIARCGANIGEAAEAIKTWIEKKQAKGKSTEHILAKLESMEKRYLMDPSLYEAFHKARALTALPRSKVLPTSRHCRSSPTPSHDRSSRDSFASSARPLYSPRSFRSGTASTSSPPSLLAPESPFSPQFLPPRISNTPSVNASFIDLIDLLEASVHRQSKPPQRLRDPSPESDSHSSCESVWAI